MEANSCACYGSNDIHECYCNLKNNNMKQTAIEWLMDKLPHSIETQFSKQIEQAKAMEKEQIIKAYEYTAAGTSHYGEQYYNETYNK